MKRIDIQALRATAEREPWRPWKGMTSAAARIEALGLIAQCGTDAMPPHKLYCITDAGREALAALNT